MPQVVIEQPGVPPMTVPLSGEETNFGRAEDNDVVLVADEVSRHHAVVRCLGGKTLLVDKASMNGTYVNRQRVVERVLSHLDEVWFGSKCRLVFRDDTNVTPQGQRRKDDRGSKLREDVDKIREEMDRVGSSLTLIAKKGRTPQIRGGAQAPPEQQPTPGDLLTMSRAYRRLEALYRASRLIASEFDLSRRLSDVLDTAVEVMEAERGFVMLRGEDSDELRVSVAREMGQDLAASSPSMGIAGKAAIDGEPVLMTNSDQDHELRQRESIIRQRITGAMAVPLKIEERVLGSIYVDTRREEVTFDEQDLELFASLAAQSAMAIDNVQLYEKMIDAERTRGSLSRFLSPAIVDEVMRSDSSLELGGSKRTVTTLFCDIRGFTPIAEQMPAVELVELLNEHFTAMTEIVFGFDGTLDKYVGDEIMAVFGAPLELEDDACHGVRAALAFQARNAELNEQRRKDGRPELHLGIGINSGDVIAGCVGSPMKLDFTVMGDAVNVASRLCSLAKAGQVLVGKSTYEQVASRTEVNEIGMVQFKGKAVGVEAFEILRFKEE
ncbi:MAG: GAF domain-containing protein [Nitrospiraceae bacterium]|nr:GAF domain-containing protein [Nitrospiraceae bacterium]